MEAEFVRERGKETAIMETILFYAAGASIISGKAKAIETAIKKVRDGG